MDLIGENNQVVTGASAALGTDFTASLPFTGPFYLELHGTVSTAINYSFQITDSTTYPPIASSGFDTPQSGTLASGASAIFTFQAPAGLPVYFNNLGFSEPMTATLTDPNNLDVFSYDASSSSAGAGPYVLTTAGTYTLTLNNTSTASGTYDFSLLSLPSAATSLALGPTQTVSGTLSPGTATAVYSFLGAASERIFLDNQDVATSSVDLQLIGPDNGSIFTLSSNGAFGNPDSGPVSLTESGTYYLLVEGGAAAAANYQFRLTDTAYSPLTASRLFKTSTRPRR